MPNHKSLQPKKQASVSALSGNKINNHTHDHLDDKTSHTIMREIETPLQKTLSRETLIHLQRTIGNFATLRLLDTNSLNQPHLPASIMQTPTTDTSLIQRRLTTTSADLSGKTARTGAGKPLDNRHLSTFRLIEKALDNYHSTGVDDSETLITHLETIIKKSNQWLSDKSHKKDKDKDKRSSLEKLKIEAQSEFRRVAITKELGIPRQIVEAFDDATRDGFWSVVIAFQEGKGKTAIDLFTKFKPKLGDAGDLIESFMKRNKIAMFDKGVADTINNPDFKMKDKGKGSADAIQLIKKQAQEKLDRLAELKKMHEAAHAEVTGVSKTPPSAKNLEDFKIILEGTPLNKEFQKLNMEKAQYEGIVSGKSVSDKKKDDEFKKFSETELYGLMGYTSNLYGAINTPLRKDVGSKKFTEGHAALAGSITSALHKMKPYQGTVYRHGGDFKGYALVNIVGATVSDMAPLSTAVDQKGPANAAETHEVLEIIRSKTGRDVSKASVFGGKEGEVLFAPGTNFRVVAAFERNGAFVDKEHKDSQYEIKGQEKMLHFAEAMKAVNIDDKKNMFKRVVIKEEV